MLQSVIRTGKYIKAETDKHLISFQLLIVKYVFLGWVKYGQRPGNQKGVHKGDNKRLREMWVRRESIMEWVMTEEQGEEMQQKLKHMKMS